MGYSDRIDHLSSIDLNSITLDDWHWRYGTGVDKPTGWGRYKEHHYRHGVQTKLGDIEISVWVEVAEKLVEREKLTGLLKNLKEFLDDALHKSFFTDDLKNSLNTYALQLCIDRIFDDLEWVDYIPFNRKYRPEVLKTAHLVTIIPECCGKLCEITEEQLKSVFVTVHCPNCGRWSRYKIKEKSNDEN